MLKGGWQNLSIMAKLWSDSKSFQLNKTVEAFCFAQDVVLDRKLVYYDILGSIAHATMLGKIGILSAEELEELHGELRNLWREYQTGKWEIETADEDVHTAVETRLGKVGEKLHTARSRNDQVLLDMRLYGKEQIHRVAELAIQLAQELVKGAQRYQFVPMPGYTHLQRAMPSSCGMWFGAYAEGILDSMQEIEVAYRLFDQSPLGSGAGYGVSLDIDRKMTSDLMGFAKVQNNSLYCQNSRGLFESTALSSLASLSALLGRFASDVCLFCSSEFGFLELPEQFFTGSSIMPQKRNPDLFELVRAKVSLLCSLEIRTRSLVHGLISGYSKDLQEVKAPLMEGFESMIGILSVVLTVMPELKPNKTRMSSALDPQMFATHQAYQQVKQGVPFRRAYKAVKEELGNLPVLSPEKCIREMKHQGATGNLGLENLGLELGLLDKSWQTRKIKLEQNWQQLLEK